MSDRPGIPDRIQWHEGMLLSPQHFQQESARVDSLIAWHARVGHAQGWGIRHLEFDNSLLDAGCLRILRLEAVLPDGTAVSHDARDPEDGNLEVDLKPLATALESDAQSVYLALGQHASLRDHTQPTRFRGVRSAPVEDQVSEALAVDIPRMRHRLVLSVGEHPAAIFVSMKIATVLKDNQVFRLGPFVPPLLELQPDHPLLARVASLAAQIRSKSAFLAKQSAAASASIEDRLAFLEHRHRLASLSMALPLLEAVLKTPRVQPHPLFLALCAQLGPMALLRPGAMPMVPPSWQHADPAASFDPVMAALEDAAEEVSQDWRVVPLSLADGVFSLELNPEWLGNTLLLGLKSSTDAEAEDWMRGAIIGSKVVWTSLSDRRVLGAARRHVTDAPELGVRASCGYSLYKVEVSAEHIIAEQPLLVGNPNQGRTGGQPRELVLIIKG